MIGLVVRPSIPVRFAVILTAAMALLLPSPARCDGCGAGASECPHCVAAKSNVATTPARPCCQPRTATNCDTSLASSRCVQVHTAPCDCSVRPADRAWVPAERQLSVQDILATLPVAQPLQLDAGNHSILAVAAFGDLPPPVPHRVLHCSWII
jgi:hypothetical protein